MARNARTIPWRLAGLGLELGLFIGGLTYLGYLADGKFNTEPWLALAGALIAMVGGTYTIAREVLSTSKRQDRDRSTKR